MRKLVYLLIAIMVLATGHSSFAQTIEKKQQTREERKEERKLLKAERKNKEQRRLKENYRKIVSQIKDSAFVIETHTLFDRYNNSYQVSPTTNFVMVEGDQLTLQLGFDGRIGYNGLGGITIEGDITDYEILEMEDGGAARIRMNVNSLLLGSTLVNITINRDGYARAYVSGVFRTRLSFNGNFMPLEESIVYKGTTIF